MLVLRVNGASFTGDAESLEPFSAEVAEGARVVREFANERSAAIAARLAAGIVKPSAGAVFIGEYHTRIQPVQAKARAAFVPRDTAAFARGSFSRELGFFADIYGIERAAAQQRARAALAALGDDDYARAVALALIREVPLLVLDRPPEHLYDAIAEHTDAAIFATRAAGPASVRALGARHERRAAALRGREFGEPRGLR
jgi:ABC-type Na+ transport system ATPase subunit NatA